MAVIGNHPPARVTINELTTIASAWTHNQFIDGTAIEGPPLALRIAASHVPSFVDLATGGYGQVIGDALNSAQTPTLANFATLANVLAGCVARLKADACRSVFAAARGLAGSVPTDTLAAAEAIARYPATFGKVDEALQTLGAGQGVVVFHGMAKPVKVPMIGPVRAP